MQDDDDDLDSVLLGGNVNPGHMAFDPFSEAVGTDDLDGDGGLEGHGTDAEPDYGDGFGRYKSVSIERGTGESPDDSGPLSWAGTRDQPTVGYDEWTDRQREDSGDRNLRRVAEQRSGGIAPGGAGSDPASRVANSIRDAQQRIRAHIQPNGTANPGNGVRREYQKREILAPPEFQNTHFEATISQLKSNTNGEWMVMLKVPPEYRNEATVLGDAYGLALNVDITRKRYSLDGDT